MFLKQAAGALISAVPDSKVELKLLMTGQKISELLRFFFITRLRFMTRTSISAKSFTPCLALRAFTVTVAKEV